MTAAVRKYGPRPVPIANRFWPKVDQSAGPEECWPWVGARRHGYGVIGSNSAGTFNAHRIAWTLTNGDIPAGLCVCHKCDNRACCNPGHLFLGTYADNNADMARKGRHAARVHPGWGLRGERHPMAKLSAVQVSAIRSSSRPTREIAIAFGVSGTCVKDARSGRTWR